MTDLIDIGNSFSQGVNTGLKLQEAQQQRDLYPLKKEAAQQKIELNNIAIGKAKDDAVAEKKAQDYLDQLKTAAPVEDSTMMQSPYEKFLATPVQALSSDYAELSSMQKQYAKSQQELQARQQRLQTSRDMADSVPAEKRAAYLKALDLEQMNIDRATNQLRDDEVVLAKKKQATAGVVTSQITPIIQNIDMGDEKKASEQWNGLRNGMVEVFKGAASKDIPFQQGMPGPDGKPINTLDEYNQVIQKIAEQHADDVGIPKDYSEFNARNLYGKYTTAEQQAKDLQAINIAKKNAEHAKAEATNAEANRLKANATANKVASTGDKDKQVDLIKEQRLELDKQKTLLSASEKFFKENPNRPEDPGMFTSDSEAERIKANQGRWDAMEEQRKAAQKAILDSQRHLKVAEASGIKIPKEAPKVEYTKDNPFISKDPSDVASLPTGSYFKAPNGKTYQKH